MVECWKHVEKEGNGADHDCGRDVVPNFRSVAGLHQLYRSSAPDNLADLLGCPEKDLEQPEKIIFYNATLLIDLRNPEEQNRDKLQLLMDQAPGGPFLETNTLEMLKTNSSPLHRQFFPCPLTSRSDISSYAMNHWASSSEEANRISYDEAFFWQVLKEHGVEGLFEIILSSDYIDKVLKAITLHLEQNPQGQVVFYCSIGKDRTGTIAMLCQMLLGLPDRWIVDDFVKSSGIESLVKRSFRKVMSGSPGVLAEALPEAMIETLKYVRNTYGSIELYLESKGFDASWQSRFIFVMTNAYNNNSII